MKTNYAMPFLRAGVLLTVAVFGGNILAQAQTLTTLHSFTGTNGDGQEPYPQHLAFDSTGALYGTTVTNGSPYWGTVFQLAYGQKTRPGASEQELSARCSAPFEDKAGPEVLGRGVSRHPLYMRL